MNRCETLQNDLKAYVDGQLPLPQRLAVRWHVGQCAACRAEINAMEQIGKDLRANDPNQWTPDLRAKILAGVSETAPLTAGTEGLQGPEGMEGAIGADAPAAPLSKWRRKPMLLWGATCAAAVSWFIFYPAVTRLTNLSPGVSEASSAKQTGANLDLNAPRTKSAPVGAFDEEGPRGPQGPQTQSAADSAGASVDGRVRLSAPRALPALSQPALTSAAPAFGRAYGGNGLAFKAKSSAGVGAGADKSAADESDTRQVHKEADISVEVDRPEEKSQVVEQMVKDAGGYVANNTVETEENGVKSASLTTKVPVDDFENFLGKVAKLGDVKAKTINGEDITEQISDHQATTQTLSDEERETEARLRQGEGRTQTRQDRETMRELRIRIAQTQARLKALRKQAALATITVQLRGKPPVVAPPKQAGFLDDVNEASHSALLSFKEAAKLPVLTIIWIVAYAPIWIGLALAYRYAVRT